MLDTRVINLMKPTPKIAKGYPFSQGLPRDMTLRLLTGGFKRRDLDRYYRTSHFQDLKARVIDSYRSCVLCGVRDQKRLTAHHRHYRSLFQEDVMKDVSCICRTCHRRHHRK